jgi:bla regulator protein BlaR1
MVTNRRYSSDLVAIGEAGLGNKMVLTVPVFLAIALSAAFGIGSPTPMHAQILHATGPRPSFEVATVKPVQPRPIPPPPPPGATDNRPPPPRKVGIGTLGGQQTHRIHLTSSAGLLVLFAYNLPFGSERTRIVGGPDWLLTAQYDIQAKIDDSLYAAMQKMAPEQQREQVDLMEQSLLAERFELKMHFETRDMPVYALVVAKGGLKLTPAKDGETTSISSLNSEMIAKSVTLDDFAQSSLWTPIGGRLVVDQTGLKGAYDFTLNWGQEQIVAPEAGQESAPVLSPIFTAIQQQLGLKLVPTKAPVEVMVIDHIEKPSEN